MYALLILISCNGKGAAHTAQAESGAEETADETAGPDSVSGDSVEPDDSSVWECRDEGMQDSTTLCYDHTLYPCTLSTIGLRRGDWLCWPAHAFCPEPGVYCNDTTEGWTELPLAVPSDFRAVAEGVIEDPELVFTSPIDEGFVPTRSVTATTITEAYYAFYYDEVVAGEEVVLKDGTYTDCYIGFEGHGEPGRPLVLRAETPGGVTLDGCAIYMDGSYLVLSGFRFTGRMGYTPIAMGYSGASCDWCAVREVTVDTMIPDYPTTRPYVQILGRGAEVSDSTFIGKANTSAVITVDREDPSTPLEARVYRNEFLDRNHDLAAPGETNGFEVIRAGWSMDYFYPGYIVVEGNLFERCDGELETISLKSGHNAVRFNTFRDSAGQISVRDGFGNIIEGNYILGQDKADSGGIRASGAGTLIIDNHIQDIVPNGSRWLYPVALVTGSDDAYENYTSTFEGGVLFNRAISARYGFALDTGEDYPPSFYPPYENVYAYNLFFTEGADTTLGYTWEDSLDGNRVVGNELDVELGLSGFALSTDTVSGAGELSRVPAFDAEISLMSALDLLDEPTRDLAEQVLVLDGPLIYDRVPVLSEGDVGGP